MERKAFLDRLRLALNGDANTSSVPSPVGPGTIPDFYRNAPLGDNPANRVDRFVAELEAVSGRVIRVSTEAEAGEALRSLVAESKSIIAWDRSEFAGWGIDWLWDDCGAKLGGVDLTADFGVTTVDYVVANTGTIVLTTAATRPRTVSLVISTHIALVRAEQVVDRVGEAYAGISARGPMPSGMYSITGPSRSADIENDLTIGVHGPAALVIILLTPQTGIRYTP